MRLIVAASLFFLSSSSFAASPSTCWLQDGGCRSFVGKRFWVAIPRGNPNVVEVTFTRGDWTTERTLKLKSGSSFVVKDVVKASVGSDDYYIVLDDGRFGWVGTASTFLIDFDPTARAKQQSSECEKRGQPKIGMSSNELIASCWGKPMRIIKKTTPAGIDEVYLYGSGNSVRFADGKIVEVVEAR